MSKTFLDAIFISMSEIHVSLAAVTTSRFMMWEGLKCSPLSAQEGSNFVHLGGCSILFCHPFLVGITFDRTTEDNRIQS